MVRGAVVRWCVRRCEGAMVPSLALFALALLLIACSADAQNPRTVALSDAPSQRRTIAPVAPQKFDSSRAWMDLHRQVQFRPRPAGSPALAQCRPYIEAHLNAADI